ncbi:hypothetical protein O6H91_15G029500 [Diphasiastrum complanatum]|uniref:Uncharacterized protein n=1 Tax=Diphasiastrum complanatum TaxID=34168 RepID=A0ACC2BGS1_DIPCM|nr:hypothetical protein O6H91_15G029500 [Diphasiastrum complanatum]
MIHAKIRLEKKLFLDLKDIFIHTDKCKASVFEGKVKALRVSTLVGDCYRSHRFVIYYWSVSCSMCYCVHELAEHFPDQGRHLVVAEKIPATHCWKKGKF